MKEEFCYFSFWAYGSLSNIDSLNDMLNDGWVPIREMRTSSSSNHTCHIIILLSNFL